MRIPAIPPQPQRDSFFARSRARDWDEVARFLVEYWQKVAEVLPQYYRGRTGPDPLANEPPLTVPPDAGWNRLVFIVDAVYGKFTTHLWTNDEKPRHLDRVWVIVKFPMIEKLTVGPDVKWDSLTAKMISALAGAAEHPAARDAVVALRAWRDVSFWVMEAEDPATLRSLAIDAATP
jgi:hypothetical protein